MREGAPIMLLTSGGIDSTALIDFYKRRGVHFSCLHFQYGQASAKSEDKASLKVCRHFGVKRDVTRLRFPMRTRKDELLCRNTFFVLAAASQSSYPTRIALGIHSGPPYYDCTRAFVEDCQRLLDGYFAGQVQVEAPFLEFSKRDIADYCRNNDVPVVLTYSCLRQNYPPCGECPSCADRLGLFEIKTQ